MQFDPDSCTAPRVSTPVQSTRHFTPSCIFSCSFFTFILTHHSHFLLMCYMCRGTHVTNTFIQTFNQLCPMFLLVSQSTNPHIALQWAICQIEQEAESERTSKNAKRKVCVCVCVFPLYFQWWLSAALLATSSPPHPVLAYHCHAFLCCGPQKGRFPTAIFQIFRSGNYTYP